MNKDKVLILGGAGFLGSNIANMFYKSGYQITIIDGLMRHTGGSKENLKSLHKIKFIAKAIEQVKNLEEIVRNHDLIIDCMAWTSHLSALENPEYDLKLNLISHLHFIRALKKSKDKKILYLGSRGQYGNLGNIRIRENQTGTPLDIQGIHKAAAENYFKIYSKLYGFNLLSLRITNCFGLNQPYRGKDVGLVGGFIRQTISNNHVEIFGKNRKREILFAEDLAKIIKKISEKDWAGFDAYNIGGQQITLEELVKKIVKISGQGGYELKKIPAHIANIDTGNSFLDNKKLVDFIGNLHLTKLDKSLSLTIDYFKTKKT